MLKNSFLNPYKDFADIFIEKGVLGLSLNRSDIDYVIETP